MPPQPPVDRSDFVDTDLVAVTRLKNWHTTDKRFSKAEQIVLAQYFDLNTVFAKDWDLWLYKSPYKEIHLVPLAQVTPYLASLAARTGFTNGLTSIPPSDLIFSYDPKYSARPVFIGSSKSHDDFLRITSPTSAQIKKSEEEKAEEKRKKKEKALAKRNLSRTAWEAEVRLARQYLGFGVHSFEVPEGNTEDIPAPPYLYTGEPVVLKCVDVEAYELDQRIITEIGIATLDTALFPAIEHDRNDKRSRAEKIISLIEYRHLRITEHRNLRNGRFVRDAADAFEFGTSEFVLLADIPAVLGEAMRHFSTKNGVPTRRKTVLLGHDVKADISLLRHVGYDVWNISGLEVLDTTNLWRAVTGDLNGPGLEKILAHYEMVYWNLHNAGNDAAYTLQAFIKLAEQGTTFIGWVAAPRAPTPQGEDTAALDAARVGPSFDYGYEELADAGLIRTVPEEGQERTGSRRRNRRGRRARKSPKEDDTVAQVVEGVRAVEIVDKGGW